MGELVVLARLADPTLGQVVRLRIWRPVDDAEDLTKADLEATVIGQLVWKDASRFIVAQTVATDGVWRSFAVPRAIVSKIERWPNANATPST